MANLSMDKFFLALILFISVAIIDAGVSGLNKHLRSRYSNCWTTSKSPVIQVDHVCIDMNQLLHSSSRNGKSSKHIFSHLFVQIDGILKTVVPSQSVVLAFDGPAPFAKMMTQRSRRESNPTAAMITPGTILMDSVENMIVAYVLQRANRSIWRNVTFFISSPSIPGEGELKVISWIKRHMPGYRYKNETVVVCGSDSDILLQAMTINTTSNVLVLNSESFKSTTLCNITKLTDSIADRLSIKSLTKHMEIIFLYILHGNDYLPRLRGSSMANIISSYATTMAQLQPEQRYIFDYSEQSFNYYAIYLFMKELSDCQFSYFQNATLSNYKPSIIQEISVFAAKTKLYMNWNETFKALRDPGSKSGSNRILWISKLTVGDKEFESVEYYPTRREARAATATLALEQLDNGLFKQFQHKSNLAEKLAKQLEGHYDTPEVDKDASILSLDGEGEYGSELSEKDLKLLGRKVVSRPANDDDDVEVYLRGLMWVLLMYDTGSCWDFGFTYGNRPSVTPQLICSYLERKAKVAAGINLDSNLSEDEMSNLMERSEFQLLLKEQLNVFKWQAKPLSPQMNSICVLPEAASEFIPNNLRPIWKKVQSQYFAARKGSQNNLSTYDGLIQFLELLEEAPLIEPVVDEASDRSQVTEPEKSFQGAATRHRELFKSRKKPAILKKSNPLPTDLNATLTHKDIPIFPKDSRLWLILGRKESMNSNRYNGKYLKREFRLPWNFPFKIPMNLDGDYHFFQSQDTISSLNKDFSRRLSNRFQQSENVERQITPHFILHHLKEQN